MYLTDKLPGPNYHEIYHNGGKIYKNKSESKFKLPKLTNSIAGTNT